MTEVRMLPEGLAELLQPNGAIAALVREHANITAENARQSAPKRTGLLRSKIYVRSGADALGCYSDAVTSAQNQQGFGYAALLQHKHPYIRPS